MLCAVMKCGSCGTTFQVDLDRDSTNCPQCGSSNTSSSGAGATTKRVLSPGNSEDRRTLRQERSHEK
jgi:transcription elongation factor Elf1